MSSIIQCEYIVNAFHRLASSCYLTLVSLFRNREERPHTNVTTVGNVKKASNLHQSQGRIIWFMLERSLTVTIAVRKLPLC